MPADGFLAEQRRCRSGPELAKLGMPSAQVLTPEGARNRTAAKARLKV
jgi:hypothetical protein